MPLTLPSGAWLLTWPNSWDEWNRYAGEWGLTQDTQWRALALGYWADRACGVRLWIISGRRSAAEQAKLYEAAQAGRSRLPAAEPGKSAHEYGQAFDVGTDYELNAGQWGCVAGIARRLGLSWGGDFSTPDRPHFQLASYTGP